MIKDEALSSVSTLEQNVFDINGTMHAIHDKLPVVASSLRTDVVETRHDGAKPAQVTW